MSSNQGTADVNSYHNYTHFILAIQWFGGVCAGGYSGVRACPRESARPHWTIHGLWPSSEGSHPAFCSREKFDEGKLEKIKDQLIKYWPSFTSTSDKYNSFWKHEWLKHGTCASDVPELQGLENFFSRILEIYQKYADINKYLEASNIRASASNTYSVKEIASSIKRYVPYKFDIVCITPPGFKDPVLSEIRFCLDKELKPTNCKERYFKCGKQLVYLPSV